MEIKLNLTIACEPRTCRNWRLTLFSLPGCCAFRPHQFPHISPAQKTLSNQQRRIISGQNKQTNKKKLASVANHLECPFFSAESGGFLCGGRPARGDTTGPIRECEVQKIGLYDTETGIKPRPEVTHLLNHGNLSIPLPVCTRRRDINSELVMAKGERRTLIRLEAWSQLLASETVWSTNRWCRSDSGGKTRTVRVRLRVRL